MVFHNEIAIMVMILILLPLFEIILINEREIIKGITLPSLHYK
jgi:hypothetical protein